MGACTSSSDPFRTHGGRVHAARMRFPQARGPWIDLSTGVSPWSYPHQALGSHALTQLPDPQAIAELEAAAAASFGVREPACVAATPGSDLALRLLGRQFANARVAVVRPGYAGHVLMWEGMPITEVPAADIEASSASHDVVLLANPNNPDGLLISRERLLSAAATLAGRSGVLMVDEAFADAVPEHSLCPALDDCGARRLVVCRSFGKFFGLAGVRLGFVVAPPGELQALRRAMGDWPVSGPAAAIGAAAYRDVTWQAAQRRRLATAAQRLDELLVRAGLAPAGGTCLFRLARCADADTLFAHLAMCGILTRPFSDDRTLLRVGLPAVESQWQRLADALDSRCMQ
jgi:cobalamin biosynthesis protein CobC